MVPCDESVGLTPFPQWGNAQPQYRNRLVLDAISSAAVGRRSRMSADGAARGSLRLGFEHFLHDPTVFADLAVAAEPELFVG